MITVLHRISYLLRQNRIRAMCSTSWLSEPVTRSAPSLTLISVDYIWQTESKIQYVSAQKQRAASDNKEEAEYKPNWEKSMISFEDPVLLKDLLNHFCNKSKMQMYCGLCLGGFIGYFSLLGTQYLHHIVLPPSPLSSGLTGIHMLQASSFQRGHVGLHSIDFIRYCWRGRDILSSYSYTGGRYLFFKVCGCVCIKPYSLVWY